ncbi:serine-rich adhesin for platelets-like isoform X2 [Sitodiplosis mosellana]|uniref:serine-rich adhesin for platelets-like isoform X2 n=1 Tax=Sitodiplosis mosellana TaxID=263140 RepID=UPI002444A929|nr:serine-rich adhesin for platelets-like isoform X2 [Sitodiplosis mosellana]
MSIQIAEISQRLQSALDQSYNVADMDTVLQVITQLENIQITKEQLETTRLGKYINHLRRKTANESLARRAKNLLKKWREMVLPPSGGAAQQQPQQQTIPRDFPAQPFDGRGGQFYNQKSREPAQFHDTSDRVSVDNSKYPTSDSRRHGRIHETGSNHASLLPPQSKNLAMAADQTEDCTRYSKFHDIKSTNLNTNVGRQGVSQQPPPSSLPTLSSSSSSSLPNFSGKNKLEPDPYRTMLPTMNENSKSHISISALPKIPKIKNSATSLRLSKHTERSHSPLVNLKETSSPKFSSITQSTIHDDNSMHAYDMQNYSKRFPSNQPPPPPSMLNGRNQDYDDNNSTVMDINSNSSSINIIEPEIIVPNVSQPSSESVNNEVVKKKHKKHKKDKKSKKQKQSSSPATLSTATIERIQPIPISAPVLELPDSLSSNSMSLFGTTSDSIKDHNVLANNIGFTNSIGTSLPSTSINASSAKSNASSLWTPSAMKSNTVSTDDLTFTGRFTKTDDNIINIDSSSGSNSPKYRSQTPQRTPISRSSSLGVGTAGIGGSNEYGSRVATDEENSSTQHISLIQQTESSRASPFESLVQQDDLLANDAAKTSISNLGSTSELQQTGKKRGRKKGSKGVDSRLGSASNSSHSQQTGAPYYDSISFSSLKNKIDLIRGTTKKVKTTKELLAELQNRKASATAEDISAVESQLQSYQDADENGFTNGKHNSGSRTATPTSPMLSSHTRTASSERVSSKKSKSAAKDGSVSDNQSSYENPAIIDNTEPKSEVDKEMDELHAKLPPVNKAALRSWQKTQLHDTVVCTCKLIEVTDTDENVLHDSNTKDPSITESVNVPKMLTDCNVLPQAMPIDGRPSTHGLSDDQSSTPFNANAATKSNPHTDFNSTVATSTSISIKTSTEPPEPMVKKPTVKSIFDLDYEEDDDPITFKLNHNNNINLNTTKLNKLSSNRHSNNDISDDKSCDELFLNENNKREDGRGELGEKQEVDDTSTRGTSIKSMAKSNLQNVHNSGQTGHVNDRQLFDANIHDPTTIAANANVIPSKSMHDEPMTTIKTADLNAIAPPQPRFRIEEDVNCKAKQLYITTKQLITEFHIEKLHTSYIPNVNGNWDDAKCEESSVKLRPADEKPTQMICDNDAEQAVQSDSETIAQTTTTIAEPDNGPQPTETKTDEEDIELLEMEPRITEASIGLYERVVPLCNHLILDRLPKNLNHINLDFGPSDEVEPHIFLASITVKKEVIAEETESPPLQSECKTNATDRCVRTNDNNCDLVADDSFGARIHRDFPIYGCDNDIDDIDCGRKRSPDIDLSGLDQPCESIPTADFECEPVEQLSEMEVDDIVISNDDELKSDKENDLYPMASDPYVESMEPKHYHEESDIESYNGSEAAKPPSPVIDENARAGAHDNDNVHQVINLSPNQILPATDENAVDSMDFENQLSKSFDMAMVGEQRECKIVRDRSDGFKSSVGIDAELDQVGSIPTTDLSESDDEDNDDHDDNEENDDNDDSSLEDLSFDNYEQDTSNDHFITLDNFDAALVPSSSELKQSQSSNSGSSCDEEANKEAALDGKLFGNMVCDDDENEIMSDSDDIDDDSDTINNLVVPTMFCKPVFIEGGKSSNLSNENSDSQSAANSDESESRISKRLNAESLESDHADNDNKLVEDKLQSGALPKSASNMESNEPHVHQKLTKDALETHQALSSLNETSNQQKRFRSSSSSSTSSTSSTTSSSSTLSPRSKKMKRWMRRRPCPQHYRCASTSSQSSSQSPMSALSPSSMFTTSNAIEPSEPTTRMDVTESGGVKEFTPISNPDEHNDAGSDDDHVSTPVVDAVQEQQQLNTEASHDEQVPTKETVLESHTSPAPDFVHDELIESNASLTGNHDDDLLFQNTLPEQLFQSDEKDGDGDSNSVDGIHRNGVNQDHSPEPADEVNTQDKNKEKTEPESSLSSENNGMLPSFNNLGADNTTGVSVNGYKFKEWYEVVHVKSYNDELLTILPYVVID